MPFLWYIDPDGVNLEEVINSVRYALERDALPWFDRFGDLLFDKVQLSKSNEYYHKIHPTEAAEVDERLAAKKK